MIQSKFCDTIAMGWRGKNHLASPKWLFESTTQQMTLLAKLKSSVTDLWWHIITERAPVGAKNVRTNREWKQFCTCLTKATMNNAKSLRVARWRDHKTNFLSTFFSGKTPIFISSGSSASRAKKCNKKNNRPKHCFILPLVKPIVCSFMINLLSALSGAL